MPSKTIQLDGRKLPQENIKKYLEDKGWQNITFKTRKYAKGTLFIYSHRNTDNLYGRLTRTTLSLNYSNETKEDELHDLEEILR